MVFGRKKKVEAIEEPEVADLELEAEELEQEVEEKEVEVERLKEIEEPREEIVQPKKTLRKPVEPVKDVKPTAKIMSGEALEGGLFRYIVISNKSIGEIGEEFEI